MLCAVDVLVTAGLYVKYDIVSSASTALLASLAWHAVTVALSFVVDRRNRHMFAQTQRAAAAARPPARNKSKLSPRKGKVV